MEKQYIKNYSHEEWDGVAAAYNSLLDFEQELVQGSYMYKEVKRIESILLKAMYESGNFVGEIKHVGCDEYILTDI